MKTHHRFNPSLRAPLALLLSVSLFASVAFGQATAVAPKPASSLTASEREAAAQVKVETIRQITTELAAREMEGRGTAQPGGERAAKYIADKFSKMGLKPLGDAGSFLQAINFKTTQPMPDSSFKAGDVELKFGTDFLAIPPYTAEQSDASGGLVFVGYGVTSTDLKRDDLAGLDVKGKVVVVLRGRPKSVDEAAWRSATNQMALGMNLIGRGAVAMIFTNIGTTQQPFSVIANYVSRRRATLGDAPEPPTKLPPILAVSDDGAEKLFSGTGMTYAEARAKAENGEMVSRELNKQASISVRVKKETGVGHNVVGILEGSDPKLKEQAVVYTAHYDAYGIDAKGQIFPGAADNALGVGEIMAIAEAFTKSKQKPRRSVIFLAVTGEEHGLLGARYWVNHPTWPLDKIAANLNFDGIGTEVYAPVKRVIGYGAEHSDLGTVFEEVVVANGAVTAPDPVPEERVFYRSDHYVFVLKGVPALMFLGGPGGEVIPWIMRAKKWMDTHYHQPTDVIGADWHWDGARTLAVIGLITGMRVANADAMPAWLPTSPLNKPRAAAAAAAGASAN